MVLQDKRGLIKFLVFIILLLVIAIFIIGAYLFSISKNKNSQNQSQNPSVIENPLNAIIISNTDSQGNVNSDKVVEEGVKEFNLSYINFIVIGLGISKLHKSSLGYGNPMIQVELGDDVWSSEIINSELITKHEGITEPDIKIKLSKEEAVKALLSKDIKQFMKDSVSSERTKVEMIAGKTELFSKGYLDLYDSLAGKVVLDLDSN